MYDKKNVLVAGGTGTIGIPLVKKLLKANANVTVVSLDTEEYTRSVLGNTIRFLRRDLTQFENCLSVTQGQDYVFNLVGIKGSVGIGESKAASYFIPMLQYQTNLMEAAFRNDVNRFLFVSSICAYPQSSIAKKEETVWDGMPKQNDRIPGIAKRVGEIQGEAYLHEYGWDAVRIVRPSNVFGPFDDFNPTTAQVIPALISRIAGGENPLCVWGDGKAVRDFIFSEELVDWMLVALEKAPPCVPINLGSGIGITIRHVVETILECFISPPVVEWDTTKPTGDPIRILAVENARKLIGFIPKTDFKTAVQNTVDWYIKNQEKSSLKGKIVI